MLIEHPDLLSLWLTRALEIFCKDDVQPESLVEIIVSILFEDQSENELREGVFAALVPYVHSEIQLEDFLDNLFEALRTYEYCGACAAPGPCRSKPRIRRGAKHVKTIALYRGPPTDEPTPSTSAAAAAALKIQNRLNNNDPDPSSISNDRSLVLSQSRPRAPPATPSSSAHLISETATTNDWSFNDADIESSLRFGAAERPEDAYVPPPPGKRFTFEGQRVMADDVDAYLDDGAGGNAWQHSDTVVNPCTKEVTDKYQRQTFDYHRFAELYRLTALLEDVKRFNRGIQPQLPPQPPPSEESDSDWEEDSVSAEVARDAIEKIYGAIEINDESDNEMMEKKIKDVAKFIPQNSEIPTEPEILDRLADAGMSLEPLKAEEELQEYINLKYTLQERRKYSCVHPSAVGGEWFIVPRGNLKRIRETYFQDFDYVETKACTPTDHAKFESLQTLRTYRGSSTSSEHLELGATPSNQLDEELQTPDGHDKPVVESFRSRQFGNSVSEENVGAMGKSMAKKSEIEVGTSSAIKKKSKGSLLSNREREAVPPSDSLVTLFSETELAERLQMSDSEERLSDALEICQEFEAARHDSGSDDEDSEIEGTQVFTCQVLTNLHLYDPKFEMCFNIPYRIFSSLGGLDNRGIPKLLSRSILRTLNEFPNGVTPNILWEKFCKMNGYLPKLHNLSNRKLLEYHSDELYVAHERPLPKLIFPGFLEGITDPETILRRVWHTIISFLRRKPAIPIEDIFPTIEEYSGLCCFDPLDWGFRTVSEFITFCLRYFGMEGRLIIHRVEYREDGVPKSVEYLMVNSAYLIKFLEEVYGSSRPEAQESDFYFGVPNDCMGEGGAIPFVSNDLSPMDTAIATLYYAKDPHRMFVVRHDEETLFERFQRKINDEDERKKYHNHRISRNYIHPSTLKIGMYVMVFIPVLFHIRSNYFRARIIINNQGEKKAYVYGIDVGFLKWIPYKDIRLMPKAYNVVPAAAIPVEMNVEHPMKRKWESHLAPNTLYNIVYRRRLNIRFLDYTHNLALGCKRWSVECEVVQSFDNPAVIYHSFAERFLEVFTRILLAREEKKRAEKEKDDAAAKEAEGCKAETSQNTESVEEPAKTEEGQEQTSNDNDSPSIDRASSTPELRPQDSSVKHAKPAASSANVKKSKE